MLKYFPFTDSSPKPVDKMKPIPTTYYVLAEVDDVRLYVRNSCREPNPGCEMPGSRLEAVYWSRGSKADCYNWLKEKGEPGTNYIIVKQIDCTRVHIEEIRTLATC